MHYSRLAAVIIDCKTEDLDGAAKFWSQAFGFQVANDHGVDPQHYRTLATPPDQVRCEVQQVEHASRVHLDIETDDIEAEVGRLRKLGAREVERVRSWVVMEAPTGQRFCVVRPQRADFPHGANRWD
jgi:predicted enzyme related to lactoylglutathione lyase